MRSGMFLFDNQYIAVHASMQMRELGDRMLVTSGFAPEYIFARRFRRGDLSLDDFMRRGASCYGYASRARDSPRALSYLAHNFDHARHAISWLFRDTYGHRWEKVSGEIALMAEMSISTECLRARGVFFTFFAAVRFAILLIVTCRVI